MQAIYKVMGLQHFAGMAGGFVYVDNLAAAVPIGLLGLLLLVQVAQMLAQTYSVEI